MIEETQKDLVVGDIIAMAKGGDEWFIHENGQRQTYTTEKIETSDNLYIDDELDFLMKEKTVLQCSECRSKPLFDSHQKNYYCPTCEIQ